MSATANSGSMFELLEDPSETEKEGLALDYGSGNQGVEVGSRAVVTYAGGAALGG